MNDRPFFDKAAKPTAGSLHEALGNMHKYYLDLSDATRNFNHTWNYSKSSGWIEKVSDTKKALYYLIPMNNCFKISMAIRPDEKDFILSNSQFSNFHLIVMEAKKYSEGYNIQFEITNADEFGFAMNFIDIIKSPRKNY